MNAVLLIVERPDLNTNEGIKAWKDFPKAAAGIVAQSGVVETLGENSWLIPLDKSLQTFLDLLREAQDLKLSYRMLFFQDALQWIRYPAP